MSRFRDIQQGTAAIKPVEFPLVNVPAWGMTQTVEQREASVPKDSPTHARAGARVLSPGQLEIVLEKALARAKAKGASEGSDLYNFALQLYTCAMGYVDLDSPDMRNPILYFGDSVDECVDVLSNNAHISRDTLVYLCEELDVWRDWCNPQGNGQHSEAQMFAAIEEVVADASFLLRLRPYERLTFTHTICVLLQSYLTPKSSSSSPLSEKQTSESKPTASAPKKKTKTASRKRR